MTPDTLAEIKSALAAATPGPLLRSGDLVYSLWDDGDQCNRVEIRVTSRARFKDEAKATADLVERAPTWLASLVDEVERSWARADAMKAAADRMLREMQAAEARAEAAEAEILRLATQKPGEDYIAAVKRAEAAERERDAVEAENRAAAQALLDLRSQLDAATKERDELQVECARRDTQWRQRGVEINMLRESLTRAERNNEARNSQLDAARAALKRYGAHDFHGDQNVSEGATCPRFLRDSAPCTCGLDAALNPAPKEPTP